MSAKDTTKHLNQLVRLLGVGFDDTNQLCMIHL